MHTVISFSVKADQWATAEVGYFVEKEKAVKYLEEMKRIYNNKNNWVLIEDGPEIIVKTINILVQEAHKLIKRKHDENEFSEFFDN